MPPDVVLYICTTCRNADEAADSPVRAGARLAANASAAQAPAAVAVHAVECLANCKRGPSAAMARADGWSYVFGGLDPAADGPALLEGARLLAEAPDGLMPWRGRPEALKRGIVARIPPRLVALGEVPR